MSSLNDELSLEDIKQLLFSYKRALIVDQNMNLMWCNNAEDLFNLDQFDRKSPSISDCLPGLQYEGLISDIQSTFSSLKSSKRLVPNKNGEWYLVRINPYKINEEKPRKALLTIEDATDFKNTHQELISQVDNGNGESIAKLGAYILECRDSERVLNRAVKLVSEKLNADLAGLLLTDDGNQLRLASGAGWAENIRAEKFTTDLAGDTEFNFALNKEDPVVVRDFQYEDRFGRSSVLSETEITSGILVRIKCNESCYGVLCVFTKSRREFKNYDIELVHNTANMVAESLERLKTENELRKAYDELEKKIKLQNRLEHEILQIEKKERWRVGQYLHDETAQKLLYVKMLMDSIFPKIKPSDEKTRKKMDEIESIIKETLVNTRELSHFVLPIKIGKKGVSSAFRKLVKQTEDLYEIDCRFSSDGTVDRIEDRSVASYLYYIAQEAIRNAINHGESTFISIDVYSEQDQYLNLTVKDNGKGFKEREGNQGMGINIMNYRAKLLNGTLQIKTVENGTLLKCTVPLEKILSPTSEQ